MLEITIKVLILAAEAIVLFVAFFLIAMLIFIPFNILLDKYAEDILETSERIFGRYYDWCDEKINGTKGSKNVGLEENDSLSS